MWQPAFESILATQLLMLFSFLGLLGMTGLMLWRTWRLEGAGKRFWLAPTLLLLLGLALRVGWIAWAQPEPLSDYFSHWHFAKNFAAGDLTYNLINRHPGVIVLFGFAFSLLGVSLVSGWVFNLLISLIILIQVYTIARDLFGRTAGLLALGLAAITPQLIAFSALLASELPTLAYFLALFWGVLQTRAITRRPLLFWAGLGLLLYGAVLVRSTAMLYVGLIPLLMLLRRWPLSAWKGYAAMVATTALLLSTWVYHQYLIVGTPKMFWGEELWLLSATNYEREGRFSPPAPGMAIYPKIARDWEAGTMAGELRSYEVLGQEARRIIAEDPAKYLRYGFVRMKHTLWTSAETGIRSSEEGSATLRALPEKTVTRIAAVSKHFWRTMLVLGALGLFAFRRRGSVAHREGMTLLILFLLAWLTFHYAIAVASDRWAVQITPFVLMLTAGGLSLAGASVKNALGARQAEGAVPEPQQG